MPPGRPPRLCLTITAIFIPLVDSRAGPKSGWMERRLTLLPTSFFSAGRVCAFTEDISTSVDPGFSLPTTSFATFTVSSMGTAMTVTSHPFTASAFVRTATTPRDSDPSFARVRAPDLVAPLEEVAREERAHPARSADDGDLQLSSSPILLTPAVRTSWGWPSDILKHLG